MSMSELNNKVLYIGAGRHVIIDDFPDTKEFVLIDTLPRSEFDGFLTVTTMINLLDFIMKDL